MQDGDEHSITKMGQLSREPPIYKNYEHLCVIPILSISVNSPLPYIPFIFMNMNIVRAEERTSHNFRARYGHHRKPFRVRIQVIGASTLYPST